MPLLNKFITFPKQSALTKRHAVQSDAHITNIINNIKILLQNRRTIDITKNVGLDDFSDLSIDESLMHRLCADIQQQIKLHETRLDSVEVTLAENGITCWLINVSAKLINTTTDKKIKPTQQINFKLQLAKPAYQAPKRAINGVFL